MTFLHKLAKRLASIAGAAFAIGLLGSCTEGSPQEYLGPNPGHPNPSVNYIGLTIFPNDPVVAVGDSVRLEARGWLPSGQSTPAEVAWTVSGGTLSPSGWFKSSTVGTSKVRAVSSANPSLADSVVISVVPKGGVTRVDITPSGVTLASGSRQQFTALALLADGTRMVPSVTWSATGGDITPGGLFTATGTAGGAYTVTAVIGDGGLVGHTTGVVTAAELDQLALSPAYLVLEQGVAAQFTASATWSDGSTSLPPLSWQATGGAISGFGGYTAGSVPGSYRVIVSSTHGKADTASVTILPQVTRIRLAPLTAVLALGASQVVTAYGLRSDGTESVLAVAWSAQGGTISPAGLYTAGGTPGTYPVVGRFTTGTGQVLSDTAHFQLGGSGATLVQLFVRSDTTVAVGSSVQFSVTGTWSDGGSTVPVVSWSATGGSIDASGLYRAGSVPGDYKVIATQQNGTKADTARVTLTAANVPTILGLAISPDAGILSPGQTRQFSATLTWSDGQAHPADISWVSAGGTITQNGLYTAGTVAGTFLVIATCGCGAADTTAVTIPFGTAAPVTLTQLVLSPAEVLLQPGATGVFTVAGVWSDGASSPPPVSYTATGGSITNAGLYTAGGLPGTFRVIARHGGGLADTSLVTVEAPAATLTQLVLNPSSVTVPRGATQPFAVSALWSDGSTTLPPLTWDATGGTISDGVYTAGSTAGTFRIIVSHTGGTRADTSTVTIPSGVTLTQLALNPSSVTVLPGGTQQFTVSGSWSDGSSVAPAVTWSATGGNVTAAGLYSAGYTAGTYQVIAVQTGGTKADTSVVTVSGSLPPTPAGSVAELPRVYLNTAYPARTGQVINVGAGADLQTALNNARPGDEILLSAGATYTGNFQLPAKDGCVTGGWIVVRGTQLPPEGVRVTPSVAGSFPKIVTPNVAPALLAKNGSCGWRIAGVEITGTPQSGSVNYNYGLIRFGEDETALAALPHDIVLDRVYVHGTSATSVQHGVLFNAARLSLIDSHVSEIHWPGTETHALGGWAGPGPFKVVNNYLEAASINLLFGGADPIITNLTPSDIEIRRNYLFKPLAYKGAGFAVKNLLELKHAQRVLIEGNVLENSWTDAQDGMGINVQSLSDDFNPWTQTADVTIRRNVIRNVNQCAVILAHGFNGSGIALARLNFEDNWCDRVGGDQTHRGFLLVGDLRDVRIARNTLGMNSAIAGALIMVEGAGAQNIAFVDNAASASGLYGPVFMSGGFFGSGALTRLAGTTWTFTGNVIAQQSSDILASLLPAGNLWPSSLTIAADGSVPAYPGKGADASFLIPAINGVRP